MCAYLCLSLRVCLCVSACVRVWVYIVEYVLRECVCLSRIVLCVWRASRTLFQSKPLLLASASPESRSPDWAVRSPAHQST